MLSEVYSEECLSKTSVFRRALKVFVVEEMMWKTIILCQLNKNTTFYRKNKIKIKQK
jgi:hypothetical protein